MSDQVIAIIFFIAIIALTLGITAWASRQNTGTDSHYVAGGQIKGWQNGLAISGDYLSAAPLLGLAGALAPGGSSWLWPSRAAAAARRPPPCPAARGPSPSAASRASTSR